VIEVMAKKKGRPRGKLGDAERMARMREALAARRARLAGADEGAGQGELAGSSASAPLTAVSVAVGRDSNTCPECGATLERPHRSDCPYRPTQSAQASPGREQASPAEPEIDRLRRRSFVQHFTTTFKDWFSGDSWGVWLVVAKAIFGEKLDRKERRLFTQFTGRAVPQATQAREVWLACGRRAGKDYFTAALVVFLACLRPYTFNKGELGRVMLLAVDSDQADVLYQYITELVDSIPAIARQVQSRSVKFGMRRVTFKNQVEILIKPADKRRVRGRTLIAVVCDEIAHWFSEEHHANPDTEVLAAVKPGMLGVPGAMLICISSPYRRQGTLYETDQREWGRNGSPVLFWRAATWDMRPDTPGHRLRYPTFIDELTAECERDRSFFYSEYGAEYRVDLEDYLTREQLDAVTVDRAEIQYEPGMRAFAFIDTSGGEGQDSQAFCITLRLPDGRGAVAKLVEWKPPFDSAASAKEVAEICKAYKIAKVHGDKFGGAMFASMLRQHGIGYEPTTQTATELYRGFAGAVTGKRIELLGATETAQRGINQLMRLERRQGGEKITHPEREHDDIANSIAGAALLACQVSGGGFAAGVGVMHKGYTAPRPGGRVVDSLGTMYVGNGMFRAASGEYFRDPRAS
jgi:hypothetical protein